MAGRTIGIVACRKTVHTFRIVSTKQCFLKSIPHKSYQLINIPEFHKTSKRTFFISTSCVKQNSGHVIAKIDTFPDCSR